MTTVALPFTKGDYLKLGTRVDTVNPTYDIVEFGVQHPDGTVDSLAIGGNFSALKRFWELL